LPHPPTLRARHPKARKPSKPPRQIRTLKKEEEEDKEEEEEKKEEEARRKSVLLCVDCNKRP
jgi:hypothetical protein